MPEQPSIIFFDGVCNLCSGFVRFILPRDRNHRFQFASLQSKFAEEKLRPLAVDTASLTTVVLLEGGRVYTESAAVIRIAKGLGGAWSLTGMLLVLPAFLRDAVYRFIARHRYRIFGRTQECMIPKPEWADQFLG